MFLLKISLGQDLRQITFTSLPTYSVLRNIVSCLFFDLGAKVSILYVDDEQDVVSIHSDLELQEAVRLAQTQANDPCILRLFVNAVEQVTEETATQRVEPPSLLTELGTSLANVTDAVSKFFATINIIQFFEEVSTACQQKLAELAAHLTIDEKSVTTAQDTTSKEQHDNEHHLADCLFLERMGFLDRSKNLSLLCQHKDLDKVVEILLIEEENTMTM